MRDAIASRATDIVKDKSLDTRGRAADTKEKSGEGKDAPLEKAKTLISGNITLPLGWSRPGATPEGSGRDAAWGWLVKACGFLMTGAAVSLHLRRGAGVGKQPVRGGRPGDTRGPRQRHSRARRTGTDEHHGRGGDRSSSTHCSCADTGDAHIASEGHDRERPCPAEGHCPSNRGRRSPPAVPDSCAADATGATTPADHPLTLGGFDQDCCRLPQYVCLTRHLRARTRTSGLRLPPGESP